ncbi:glycosyltransferase family 4 protein [Flaviaesturariibacter amylovorans]|uniref:Glycosyltransferase subfamily 4-like N-terminal domain-containing protein n=1 Tax=Flaviaesturariibacter amylovorans TaxID=1084520 RepID=A0ABP8H369_9BACT
MKVLSLVWFQVLPARFGGQKGIALFNEYLGRRVPLTCLCSTNNEVPRGASYAVRPELPATQKQFLQPAIWRAIEAAAREEGATHLLLEFPYHALAAFRLRRRTGIRVILHEHNIEYLRFRALRKPWWPLLRRYEGWACRNADLVLFKTEGDRDHAISVFGTDPARTLIVPYGIEPQPPSGNPEDLRAALGIGADTALLLFAGTLDYAPNAKAVEAIYAQLVPALEARGLDYRIVVCGRNRSGDFHYLNALEHPRVIRAGEVPDIAPYFAAADVFINPVLSGGGVQTKVLDALAQHNTVVSFAFGAQGIDGSVAGGKLHCVPDGDWSAFAAAVEENLGRWGHTPDAFFERYGWEGITARVQERLNLLAR